MQVADSQKFKSNVWIDCNKKCNVKVLVVEAERIIHGGRRTLNETV
jgi:hypothetical protein